MHPLNVQSHTCFNACRYVSFMLQTWVLLQLVIFVLENLFLIDFTSALQIYFFHKNSQGSCEMAVYMGGVKVGSFIPKRISCVVSRFIAYYYYHHSVKCAHRRTVKPLTTLWYFTQFQSKCKQIAWCCWSC